MKKLFLPLAALLFWILFLGQKAANRPVGPALDSLLIGKKPEASLEMLRAFCDQDRAEKDWPSFQKHVHKMGKILEQQRDFEQIDRLAAEAVRDLEKASAHDSLIAKTIIWRGYAQRSMENWTISLDHYRLAVRLFERAGFRGPSYSAALTGAAQILVRFADYSQANEFFQKGIALESSQRLLTQTANNYFWQDSLEKAFLFIQKATKCPSDGPKLDAHMGQVAGAIFFKKGDMRLARGFYEKALAIFGSLQNENPNKLRCLTGLAEIERKIQNPKKAVRLYAEAEALGRLFFKGRSREMAKLFVEQGDFFLENRQPDAAILAFQKAMTEAWPTFSSLQISENPSLENAPTEQYAMHAAARKARFLLKNEPVSSENRQNAARCFDLAFAVGEKLRAAYGRDEAKLYLQQNNYDLRRAAARNRFEIAKTATTEAEKTAELARLFNLLESGRAAVLRDALQAQKAIERLEMPDSLRKKEADFRRERALTEINLAAVSAAADSAAVANLQGRLFEIGQKQAAFLADLEKKSPDFARLRRTSETLGAFEIQKKLADSVAVLSWLDAGDRWFCAVLRRNKIDCFEAPKTPATENQLLDFERFLLDRAAQQAAPDSFFQKSTAIFKSLFSGQKALNGATDWVILPDGALHFLPFECLLEAAFSGRFADAPYLLKTKNIRYAWSASLLFSTDFDEKKANEKAAGCLQMMPFLAHSRSNLAVLAASGEELPAKTSTSSAANEAATAAFFWENAPRFSVIHLSTHASPSEIEFADRRMPITEIYAARLPASLVVLSACETGIGQISRGEGALSLSRAFASAGARSLIASFWKVNDRATARIFHRFYEKLGAGATKSAALRQSKLDFLAAESSDAFKTPWHWAGFSFWGMDGVVKKSDGFGFWKWVLGAGVFTFLVWFFCRKWFSKKRFF